MILINTNTKSKYLTSKIKVFWLWNVKHFSLAVLIQDWNCLITKLVFLNMTTCWAIHNLKWKIFQHQFSSSNYKDVEFIALSSIKMRKCRDGQFLPSNILHIYYFNQFLGWLTKFMHIKLLQRRPFRLAFYGIRERIKYSLTSFWTSNNG